MYSSTKRNMWWYEYEYHTHLQSVLDPTGAYLKTSGCRHAHAVVDPEVLGKTFYE